MIAIASNADRDQTDDPWSDLDKFEPIRHRRGGEFPVHSHASRTRARIRSRGHTAAKLRAPSFNGVHRRRIAAFSS